MSNVRIRQSYLRMPRVFFFSSLLFLYVQYSQKKVFKRKAQIDEKSPKTERCVPRTLHGTLFLFSKNIYIIFGKIYIYIYMYIYIYLLKVHQVGTSYIHQRTYIQWNTMRLFKILYIHLYLLPKTSTKNH